MSPDYLQAEWSAPPGIRAGTTLRGSHFELPGEPRFLTQVHGARVVRWEDVTDGSPEADGIVARTDNACCVVKTADCLPLLFSSPGGGEIAAAHGGWRGLAAGIIEATLEAMSTPAADLEVWLGPAISKAAFEVGDEVRDIFCAESADADAAFTVNARGRWQADLYRLARQRLERAGVVSIHGGGLCTHADPLRFYSYRRDGETGRMLSFVCRQSRRG